MSVQYRHSSLRHDSELAHNLVTPICDCSVGVVKACLLRRLCVTVIANLGGIPCGIALRALQLDDAGRCCTTLHDGVIARDMTKNARCCPEGQDIRPPNTRLEASGTISPVTTTTKTK